MKPQILETPNMIINPFRFAGWSPEDITGLYAWYRADTRVLTSGKVSEWTDQGPNGYDLLQTTPANRPTPNATGGPNSTASIDFLTTNTLESSGWVSLAQPFTTIAVLKFNSGTTAVAWSSTTDSTTPSQLVISSNFAIGDGTVNRTYTGYDTNWHYHDIDWNGASTAVKLDGTSKTPSGTVNTYAQTNLRLGANSAGNSPLNGSFAELIFVDGLISSGDRTSLENYFSDRYAL